MDTGKPTAPSQTPVTNIPGVTNNPVTIKRKRGRPIKGNKLTNAQKQAAYRRRCAQKGGTEKKG